MLPHHRALPAVSPIAPRDPRGVLSKYVEMLAASALLRGSAGTWVTSWLAPHFCFCPPEVAKTGPRRRPLCDEPSALGPAAREWFLAIDPIGSVSYRALLSIPGRSSVRAVCCRGGCRCCRGPRPTRWMTRRQRLPRGGSDRRRCRQSRRGWGWLPASKPGRSSARSAYCGRRRLHEVSVSQRGSDQRRWGARRARTCA